MGVVSAAKMWCYTPNYCFSAAKMSHKIQTLIKLTQMFPFVTPIIYAFSNTMTTLCTPGYTLLLVLARTVIFIFATDLANPLLRLRFPCISLSFLLPVQVYASTVRCRFAEVQPLHHARIVIA